MESAAQFLVILHVIIIIIEFVANVHNKLINNT